MLAEYKARSNVGIAVGLVMQVMGGICPAEPAWMAMLRVLLLFGGLGVFCWGCVSYAQGKGRNGLWGVLGITSLLGLIILVILPDDHK